MGGSSPDFLAGLILAIIAAKTGVAALSTVSYKVRDVLSSECVLQAHPTWYQRLDRTLT